jgi:hypothetical protein
MKRMDFTGGRSMRSYKMIFILLILFLSVAVAFGAYKTAAAACRDDCYAKCGTDTKCLVPCLKACGGDSIPPVPPPTPVKK